MERIIERFDKYMKLKGLNDNVVTEQMSLSIGLLGKSRKEGRDLSKKMVDAILNFYTDIEKVWFLTGVGEMLMVADKPEKQTEDQEVINEVNEPEVKLILCPECISKQKEIDLLKRENKCLEMANYALNELLDKYRSEAKKETPPESNAQAS